MKNACVSFLVSMKYYLYILQCQNGALYTGITTDLERRYQEHVTGSAKCKYTRSFPPEAIAASWELADKTLALKAEAKIKKMPREKKLVLIANPLLISKIIQT